MGSKTNSEENLPLGEFILLGALLLLITGALFGSIILSTTNLWVEESAPEEEYNGDYQDYATLGDPEDKMVGVVVSNPEEVHQVPPRGYVEGAYEYEGTVYEVRQSPTYIDLGSFDLQIIDAAHGPSDE
jgi:hypothetical protein